MIHIECDQYDEIWWSHHVGLPTSSNFDCILTPANLAPSSKAYGYQCRLLAEWLMGKPADTYQNDAMVRGLELEPDARGAYAFITDSEVQPVGLCLEDQKRYGASPDGQIDDWSGVLEIKAPTPGVHVDYLLDGKIPTKYRIQCLGQLLVTGCEYLDFMSYHPDMNPLILRMYASEVKDDLDKLHNALVAFHGVMETRKQDLIAKGYRPMELAA